MGAGSRAITMLIPFDLPALETKHPLSFFVFYRKTFSMDLLFLTSFKCTSYNFTAQPEIPQGCIFMFWGEALLTVPLQEPGTLFRGMAPA